MQRTIGLIGVPSSAGAHWPGQEQAPAAMRAAGLISQLRSSGVEVHDWGDLPRVRMRPDAAHPHPQNLGAVIEVARAVAEQVEAIVRAGELPLVIGGDCTIELGTLSGLLRAGLDPALLYFDGGLDLRTPAEEMTGILDSMGIAHMIGEPGVAHELAGIGPRTPLMPPDRIVYVGYEASVGIALEMEIKERWGLAGYPASQVRGNPAQLAMTARRDLERRAPAFAIHFDVDVINFTDCPIADVPQHNAGLTLAEAMTCLEIFTASPQLAALTITELNPDHADEEGIIVADFVTRLVNALVPA